MTNLATTTHNADLINHAIDGMERIQDGQYACDLHHELFNMGYFIIGYYQAEQWLINNVGIFAAIEEIREYEQSNFGEVNTDFSSSEKVVNMYAYIKGEEILADCPTLQKRWNERLTTANIKAIIKELKKLL
jgi:hypothetical protein